MRAGIFALVGWLAVAAAGRGQDIELRMDPEKIRGPEACGECHASAYEVWKKTSHAAGFRTLHRRESAAEIAERMGLRLIKRDSLCLDCHYTPEQRDDDLRAMAGVSCESCHGEGRDWIEVHNDYGGRDIDHHGESAEHRARRIAASRAAGMRPGSDLYAVASSCFGCHTVPREQLVNVGRHSLGSADFELAAWMRGEIRHNFLASFLDGDGTQNAERPQTHHRRLYVLGRALMLEHSLRGVAEASEQGVYLKAMQGRLRRALADLRLLTRLEELPEVESMLEAARSVRAALGQREALLAAAEEVGAAARAFLERHDGSRLATVDLLLEGRDDALAELLEDDEELVADEPAGGGTDPGAGVIAGDREERGTLADSGPAGSSPAAATPSAVRAGVPAEGERRSHLRPRSPHATLAATACQKCHGDQHAWWYGDPHYASIDPFLDGAPETAKIARLYGLSPSRLTRGDSLCMDCHGTVATARAGRETQDGVSCQSCHGPAADYLEPHQEGDKALGRERPGFRKALELGMTDLGSLAQRLRNCASCHYVTDPRLISAGHPTGVDFYPADGMRAIRHWEEPVEPVAELSAAWQTVLAERGPVPEVRRARLGEAASPAATSRTAGAGTGDTSDRRSPSPRGFSPRPSPALAAGRIDPEPGPATTDGTPRLPSFPELDAETPIEDLLLTLRRRLELLYRQAPPPRRPPRRHAAAGEPSESTGGPVSEPSDEPSNDQGAPRP